MMSEDAIKVVILAGGYGTRLREETVFRPKPMVEIDGRPILWHIMKIYAHYGFKDFLICSGYKGEVIKEYFLNYEYMHNDFTVELGTSRRVVHDGGKQPDWRVTIADTGLTTQTGGRLLRVRRYLNEQTFMLTYGDGVADVDIRELLAHHRRCGRIATVTGVRPSSRFGELRIDGDLAVAFNEKPQVSEGWINGGFFLFEPGIFDYLTGDDCILERDPLERLAVEGQLAVYRHTGYWRCMDTYRDVEGLNQDWREGAPWKVWPD